MLFKLRLPERKTKENEDYRDSFINRKKRRKVLGIDDADLQNHRNLLFGKKNNLVKRKKPVKDKKKGI